MKIKFNKENLVKATQILSTVVTTKTPLVILNNVLMETVSEKEVKLSATDLEVSVSIKIPAEVTEQGCITIPAKKFNDIIREIPDKDPIQLDVKKNNNIIIESGQCFFKLIGLPKDDFPRIPDLEKAEEIKISLEAFSNMLDLTSFSVSYDDTRPSLKGVLFIIKDNTITLVATDGRRLAKIKDKTLSNLKTEYKAIVPTKTIQELSRSLSREQEIKIYLDSNQIGFSFNGITIISRLIEGNFPDYNQIIPKEVETQLKINREQLFSAVKRTSLLTTHISQKIRMDLFKNKIVVLGSSVELGEAKEEIEIEKQEKEMSIAVNPNYLTDVLKNIPTEDVLLELTETEKPMALKIDGMDYIYVVMPMKLD